MSVKKPVERQDALRQMLALAAGSANDAVKLAWLTDAEEVDGLKLGCLTEFKRGSNGTVEIRLADRAAILEKLLEHLGDEGGAAAFLQALDRPGPSER